MQETRYEQSKGITFKEYLNYCKAKRLWFFISIAICVLLTTGYLIIKNPVYERSAQIMIKDDANPSSKLTAGLSMIQGFGGLFGTSSNVSNELISMKTPGNILEVVKRLNLDYSYSTRPFIRKIPLYGDSLPVKINISGMNDCDDASMKLELQKGKVRIYNLKKDKNKYDAEYNGTVNSVFHSPIGLIAITATKAYTGKEDMTINVKKDAPIKTVKDIEEKLDAGITEEMGSVIDLSYEDAIPQRAEDILNMLIRVYNEKWMDDENQLNSRTTQFIDNRISEITSDLGKAENTITTYKSKNNLPDVIETTKLAMETSTEVSGEIATLRGQRESAKFILNFVDNHSNSNQTLPVNLLSNDKVLSAQIEEYNKLQLEHNRIAENSNKTNSIVQNIEKQLSNMRKSIKAALANTVKQADIQMASYNELKGTNDSQVKSSPKQAKFLLSAERQQKIQEQLYIFMLQKREENVLSQAFTPYKTRILSAPMGDTEPVAPKALVLILISLAIGIILPAFGTFLNMNFKKLME
jgi:tyrosine-protein kinase Etk/Wzc